MRYRGKTLTKTDTLRHTDKDGQTQSLCNREGESPRGPGETGQGGGETREIGVVAGGETETQTETQRRRHRGRDTEAETQRRREGRSPDPPSRPSSLIVRFPKQGTRGQAGGRLPKQLPECVCVSVCMSECVSVHARTCTHNCPAPPRSPPRLIISAHSRAPRRTQVFTPRRLFLPILGPEGGAREGGFWGGCGSHCRGSHAPAGHRRRTAPGCGVPPSCREQGPGPPGEGGAAATLAVLSPRL